MNDPDLSAIEAWVTRAGLAGERDELILSGFCERCVAAGLPVDRAIVFIDTLHPVHEGRLVRWGHDPSEAVSLDYGRTTPLATASTARADAADLAEQAQAMERWRRSPFYQMLQTGDAFLRRRLTAASDDEFSFLRELRAAGMTDYVAIINRFAADGVLGEMDCVYSSWATAAPQGFSDAQVAALQTARCRFWRWRSNRLRSPHVAANLVQTYLGRDAGQRVLQRPHRARVCRAHRSRDLVQRPARLHARHRHRTRNRSSRCSTITPT